ncbi:MAG: polymerase, sigma-24 subunit, subfamily [Ignavibacteria bacterium]|nr:polymerase, sigma-24 subunit, subfamily [Ignavibacteria bacterium]
MHKKHDIKKDPKLSNEEDLVAIDKILAGNSAAFGILQKKYKRLITSLIRKMVRDEVEVEDLTQETFIKAYKSLSSFQKNYTFSAWLYKIASNSCIDYLRKKRFKTVSLSHPSPSGDEEIYLEIEDVTQKTDSAILGEEKKLALNRAIESLPAQYREIIKLRHEEELDYNDISLQLAIPLGTVKAQLFRARKLLYTELRKNLNLFTEH